MGDILLDNQAVPSTPASGKTVLFVHSTTKQAVSRDDAGKFASLDGCIRNWNTAQQSIATSDTYIAGSNIAIPTGMALQVGTTFRWRFGVTRSGAGTAAPVWVVRIGTLGTTGDAAILTFTSPAAQTNAADTGDIEIVAVLRNVGAAGILAGSLRLDHALNVTGLANTNHVVVSAVSAGFVTTTAGLIVGVSVNPGATSTWLHEVVSAEGLGL